MDIELNFKGLEETKLYAYDSIEQAAYFMGLLQQGIKFHDEMYVMEDHWLDVNSNTVTVNCISVKEAEKKMAAAQKDMLNGVSKEFRDKLGPAFKGGDEGEGGGFLN